MPKFPKYSKDFGAEYTNNKRYRIVETRHYVWSQHGGFDNLIRIYRPVIQMKIGFVWITIKKFIIRDRYKALNDARELLERLDKYYHYE